MKFIISYQLIKDVMEEAKQENAGSESPGIKIWLWKISLLLVILLASYLRMDGIQYAEFKFDEAQAAYLTLDLLQTGHLPQVGLMSSIGIYNPPIMMYLLAAPLYFSRHPVVATLYVALFNIVAVYLCYLFAKKFLSRRAGIIAALLFAVSPWPVLFSRKIWAQDFLPLFIIAFFYFTLEWIVTRKSRCVIPLLLFLSFSCQLHMTALTLLLVPVLIWLIYRPTIGIRHLLLGVGVFLLLYSPYLYYEFTHDFQNTRGFITYSKKPSVFQEEGLTIPLEMMTTLGFQYSLGQSYNEFYGGSIHVYVLDLLPILVFILGVLYLLKNIRSNPTYLVLLLWFTIPVTILLFNKTGVGHHDYILLFPLQFLVVGLVLDKLVSWFLSKKIGKEYVCGIVLTILLALVVYQLIFNVQFQDFVVQKKIIRGDYGVPMEYKIVYLRGLVNNGKTDELQTVRGYREYQYLRDHVVEIELNATTQK